MSAQPHVALLDYGAGNIRSAVHVLEHAGAHVDVTVDPGVIASADGLLVPGVGAFSHCMQGITAVNGQELITQRVENNKPVMGICVGMQVMFQSSEEKPIDPQYSQGIGLLPGVISYLNAPVVPHTGWNTVDFPADSLLFKGIAQDERFFFVHSYGIEYAQYSHELLLPEGLSYARTSYGDSTVISAAEYRSLWLTQFHPEKSGEAGIKLLSNWIASL